MSLHTKYTKNTSHEIHTNSVYTHSACVDSYMRRTDCSIHAQEHTYTAHDKMRTYAQTHVSAPRPIR